MFWKVRAMPSRASLSGRCRVILFAVEVDLALLRLVEAVDAVEKGGLAGAVGSDDGQDLVVLDIEADVRERVDAAEAQRHVVDPHDCISQAPTLALFGRQDHHPSPG